MGSTVVDPREAVAVTDEPEPTEEQTEGPVEHAEATRSMPHLFQYSDYVHAGGDAAECADAKSGKCRNGGHFHGWICLPNSIQNHDIQAKANAAKARHRRAMRDEASDAYAILESEVDDLLTGPRDELLSELADRELLKNLHELVLDVRESDERFENYLQDSEEYERLSELDEEERGEEWERLKTLMSDFTQEVETRSNGEKERHLQHLESLPEDALRETLREIRIEGDSSETYTRTYYLWLCFVCTRRTGNESPSAKRYFQTLDEFRNGSPEMIRGIEDTVRDLEGRFIRGDAAGN